MFHHLGFEVVGIDASSNAVRLARELAKNVGVDVEFRRMAWTDVPTELPDTFDAVFNDALENARSKEDLKEAVVAAYSALKAGGILLFAGRQADEWHMTVEERVDRAWGRRENPRIAWVYRSSAGQVTTIEMRERFPTGVYHHFLRVTDGEHLEHFGWFDNFIWTWSDLQVIVSEVGFSRIYRQNLAFREFHMESCVAVK